MKKVSISRAKWSASDKGVARCGSALWDSKAQAGCCLGHLLHQVDKIPWKEMDGKGVPNMLGIKTCVTDLESSVIGKTALESDIIDKQWIPEAIEINDSYDLTRKEKEVRLIKLFKKNKIQLKFTS